MDQNLPLMNSYNNKNHNNNIENNNYFYNKAASIYSGFDLIVISLVSQIKIKEKEHLFWPFKNLIMPS